MGYFTTYPWSSSASAQTIQFNYSGSTTPYYYPAPIHPPASVVEMPEGPVEWLRRRVTEITDLAYAA
jgi:hypothetical protein